MYLDKSNSMLKNFIKYSFIALCLSFFTNNLSAFEQVKEPMLNGEKFAWSEEENEGYRNCKLYRKKNACSFGICHQIGGLQNQNS